MSKAFVANDAEEPDEELDEPSTLPPDAGNYMTPGGHARMLAELNHLVRVERPEVVNVVAWAASNGDRSENGDYIYGKKRLREIDRRIRFLSKRLESAVVVDPAAREATDRVYFGATVTVAEADGGELVYSIVGIDEADPARGRISWISPLARALLKAEVGETVRLQAPGGLRELEIIDVAYVALD
ncbi:MAG: transcription elongation factor GreB [Gallionellaceae bacterium]|jgi:transcription elongation factor GreB|nr:transcription elongation factor GreB [Gallionellaceae bacterium]